ncbi:dynein associated protein-domain-containing protein [Lipomyces arxii]|uniref:dynein associated protein-domain-containing protein n=1 Tax=Lipomyces arxii TaxID=56418 RepID=UPI0034CE099F
MSEREFEDLKAKLRIVERKLSEHGEKLLDFERLKQERDKLERIIERLEGKIKPMFDAQQELLARVRELEAQKLEVEMKLQEQGELFESITLDREVAEAQEENLKEELGTVKAQLEEALLEIEILREEGTKDGVVSDPDGVLLSQLQEQNGKLKVALIRLRDQTAATEVELRNDRQQLQRDAESYTQLQVKYDAMMKRLRQIEEVADNLRAQLDIALGADKMIDDLTVKNLALSEQIEELRAELEDLEMLKELNDEIEANHLETQKQNQEEIEYRDIQIQEQAMKIFKLEEASSEYEYAIGRYHELASLLQSELDGMREDKLSEATESITGDRQTREMFELNRKLRASSMKTQVTTIDLELRKLDAQEALEHLVIIRAWLPNSLAVMRESIKTLLVFRRIAFKSQLICSILQDKQQSFTDSYASIGPITEICEQMANVSGACQFMTTVMYVSSVAEFESFATVLSEIEPVENILDGIIGSLRADSFNAMASGAGVLDAIEILKSLQQSRVQMQQGEVKVQLAKGVLNLVKIDIDNSISVSHALVTMCTAEGVYGDAEQFQQEMDGFVSQMKSGRIVLSKLSTELDVWEQKCLAPSTELRDRLEVIGKESRMIVTYMRNVYFRTVRVLDKDVERFTPVSYSDVVKIMTDEVGEFYNAKATSMVQSMIDHARQVRSVLVGSQGSIEYARTEKPWLAKMDELREQDEIDKETRLKVVQLNEDLLQLAKQLRAKDEALEESHIKIEFLNSRLQKNQGRMERLRVVESEVSERAKHEDELMGTVKTLRDEMKVLEEQSNELRSIVTENEAAANRLKDLEGQMKLVSSRDVDALNKQVVALQSTVRYLQQQYLRSSIEESLMEETLGFLKSGGRRTAEEKSSNYETGIFDSLVRFTLSSDVIRIQRESVLGWRPKRLTPRIIAASQRAEYNQLRVGCSG